MVLRIVSENYGAVTFTEGLKGVFLAILSFKNRPGLCI